MSNIPTGDVMVWHTQKWLNDRYSKYGDLFVSVEQDGRTGWKTIYALTRALQIELGMENTADAFGPATRALYGQNQLFRQDGVSDNKFCILQGALWCKGYNPGHYYSEGIDGFSTVFDEKVENAVKELQGDAGVMQNGFVSVNLMAALLSMDAFKLLSQYGGDGKIRTFQQMMNAKYEDYIGIMPCDGVFQRGTNKALIFALQAEEMMPVGVANGTFGPTTKHCCPTIPSDGVEKSYTDQVYNAAQISKFTQLFKFGLYVNGFGAGFTGMLDVEAIRAFQEHHALTVTGKADIQTWMSTMVSYGDNTRVGTACDTRFEITSDRLKVLRAYGYQCVGRYLIGGDFKEIRDGELKRVFDGGLSVFPIYQTTGTSESYFTRSQGAYDAKEAWRAAVAKGVPPNTVIYFAVDFDCMDTHITNRIIPYFEGVSLNLFGYYVGIYGPRNACIRVSNEGYAVKSFVSDMSSGFSGNLGFPLPQNWAFDQISNKTLTHNGNALEIDNNIMSGRDEGFNALMNYGSGEDYLPLPPLQTHMDGGGLFLINRSGIAIPVYEGITGEGYPYYSSCTVDGEIIGYIEPNEFYSRTRYIKPSTVGTGNEVLVPETTSSWFVTIHKPGGGILQGYIEGQPKGVSWEYEPWTGGMNFRLQEKYTTWNYNGSDLVPSAVNAAVIRGETYRVFKTQKMLDRRNITGDLLEPIPKNSLLAISVDAYTGKNYPNYIRAVYFSTTTISPYYWRGVGRHYVDINDNTVDEPGYVDVGLQHGGIGESRAIW